MLHSKHKYHLCSKKLVKVPRYDHQQFHNQKPNPHLPQIHRRTLLIQHNNKSTLPLPLPQAAAPHINPYRAQNPTNYLASVVLALFPCIPPHTYDRQSQAFFTLDAIPLMYEVQYSDTGHILFGHSCILGPLGTVRDKVILDFGSFCP